MWWTNSKKSCKTVSATLLKWINKKHVLFGVLILNFFWLAIAIESHSNSIMQYKYGRINGTIERLSKIFYRILVEYSIPGCVIPSTFLTLVNYFIFDNHDDPYVLGLPILYVLSNNKWWKCAWFEISDFRIKPNLNFRLRFPFNWKTPFGYIIAVLSATWLVFSLSLTGALPNFFFAGLCWLLAAFMGDINSDFANFIVRKESKPQNAMQTKARLYKIIRELSRVKQLSAKQKTTQKCSFNFHITFLTISD